MSEESKKGIYDQSSFDAIKPRLNCTKPKLKIETTHQGVATHSLRTTDLADQLFSKPEFYPFWSPNKHEDVLNFLVLAYYLRAFDIFLFLKTPLKAKLTNAKSHFLSFKTGISCKMPSSTRSLADLSQNLALSTNKFTILFILPS